VDEWLSDSLQIEIELCIWIILLELFGQLEGQSGLAHAAETLEAGDGDAAGFYRREQFFEFVGTSGEVGWRSGELVEGVEDRHRNIGDVLINNVASGNVLGGDVAAAYVDAATLRTGFRFLRHEVLRFSVPPLQGSSSYGLVPTLPASLPPQHAKNRACWGPRLRSPSVWANFATRLWRWVNRAATENSSAKLVAACKHPTRPLLYPEHIL
jgi:hypothetical protein